MADKNAPEIAKKLELAEKHPKIEKIEIKEHKDLKIEKIEKNETKEHKDAKIEKLEKNEFKEHKDAKHEKVEKNELKEHKDAKHENKEIAKIENKEISKIEIPEKQLQKEKDGKEIAEGPGGDPTDPFGGGGNPVAGQPHFISSDQRPDLSTGALNAETDVAKKPKV